MIELSAKVVFERGSWRLQPQLLHQLSQARSIKNMAKSVAHGSAASCRIMCATWPRW
jgi:hypothetical protein